MSQFPEARQALASIPDSRLTENEALADYTRFGIGGPATLLFNTTDETAFVEGLRVVTHHHLPHIVIGGGTNLIVSDAGFKGVILRFTGSATQRHQLQLRVSAGAALQDVVDHSISLGLKGLETMTGIPGYLGGAVYGNAGAYGHSIQELVEQVRIFDGSKITALSNTDCQFTYRESVLKKRKDWIILSVDLHFSEGEPASLSKIANEIRSIRDAKYPPSMKCAGSIFKNLLFANLPARVQDGVPANVIREGKVPSAWFLEQVGAKGMRRGDIQVAAYHANLIYNDGSGTASDLVSIIGELKKRVQDRFDFDLEEEVQYVGLDDDNGAR